MGFKDKLKEQLSEKLTQEELSLLPRGFQSLGRVIILKLNSQLLKNKNLIGEACLKLFSSVESVYLNSGKIRGKFREPEKIELITGKDYPIVEHREHGIIYRLDITKIIFSKGNLNERKFLSTLVKEGEIIVDMFAGIGYFSLPIAKHSTPKRIYSIELNPEAYKFLVENVKLNKLENQIHPILGNSKDEVLKLSESGIRADRVIMGVFPAPKDFVEEALTLTKSSGTVFHYEGVREKENYKSLFYEFKEIAEKSNVKAHLLSKRFVKSYGPNLFHIVLDIRVN